MTRRSSPKLNQQAATIAGLEAEDADRAVIAGFLN
jgi:hypothetical protein